MFRRSSHIAIHVTRDRLEEAVGHYTTVLGVVEKSRTDTGVELAGTNFTLWLEVDQGQPRVLQEFVAPNGDECRAAFEASGARVTGDSGSGFYVEDPYGLSYHVWTEGDAEF